MTMPLPVPGPTEGTPSSTPTPPPTWSGYQRQLGAGASFNEASHPVSPTPFEEAIGPAAWELRGMKRVAGKGTVYYWAFKVYQGRNGSLQRGDLLRGHASTAENTLWQADQNEGILMPKTSTQTPDISPTQGFMSWTYMYGRLVLGAGGNLAGAGTTGLWKETSASDPTLTRLTTPAALAGYQPLFMGPLAMNSGPPQLAICQDGTPPHIFSDIAAAPTLSATMHNKLIRCSGFIQTPLQQEPGASVIVFIVDGGIYTMLSTQNYTDDPGTAPLLNLPAYTYPVGVLQWGGRVRLIMGFPNNNAIPDGVGGNPPLHLTLGLLNDARYVQPMSLTLEGKDPDPINIFTMERGVTQFIIYRNGLACTDTDRVVWQATIGGPRYRDLRIQRGMKHLTGRQRKVRDLGKRGDKLIALIDEIDSTASGIPLRYHMMYDFDLDTWTVISYPQAMAANTGAIKSLASVGGIPVSPSTDYMHGMAETKFFRQWLPLPGVTAYSQRDDSARPFEALGAAAWPAMLLPSPVTYGTSVIDAIEYGGEQAEGTTTIVAGGQTATFTGSLNNASRRMEFPNNHNTFFLLDDLSVSVAQGATVTKTPQVYPFTIEGRSFVPERANVDDPWWPEFSRS